MKYDLNSLHIVKSRRAKNALFPVIPFSLIITDGTKSLQDKDLEGRAINADLGIISV